eukprot:2937809-Rhodomonas_salina.2
MQAMQTGFRYEILLAASCPLHQVDYCTVTVVTVQQESQFHAQPHNAALPGKRVVMGLRIKRTFSAQALC